MILSAVTLHGSLRRLGVDAILFNSSEILPSVNLRHVSGFTGSDGAVLITERERHRTVGPCKTTDMTKIHGGQNFR